MLDFIGAPGRIRTPDPQIRSLGFMADSKSHQPTETN